MKSQNVKALLIMLAKKLHASLTRKENVERRDSRRFSLFADLRDREESELER